MDIINSLTSLLQKWFATFTTLPGGLQLGALILCFTLALLTHKHWQKYITRLLSVFDNKAVVYFILNATERITFPVSMLTYLILCHGILGQLEFNTTLLDIFTPLLLSLAAVRLAVFILRRGFAPSPALKAWEGVIGFIVWSIVALHLIGWLPDILQTFDDLAVNFGETRFSVLSLFKLIIAIIIFILSANWLSKLIERNARRSPHISPSLRVGLTKFSKFFLYTLAILFALNSVGIDLTTFAVFSGALGVGIGFGLQRIASNFISGFILLFDRSIRPGDVISIGDRFGWVQALHARYIVVRDRDGVETLIPNENLITSEVTNWSYTDRIVRLRMPVQISYADDPEVAMNLLTECAHEHERCIKNPEPVARLIGFGDNGIDLELRIWINDPETGVGNVRSDVNLAIWKSFQQNNITIPFPQRDIRMIPADQ